MSDALLVGVSGAGSGSLEKLRSSQSRGRHLSPLWRALCLGATAVTLGIGALCQSVSPAKIGGTTWNTGGHQTPSPCQKRQSFLDHRPVLATINR